MYNQTNLDNEIKNEKDFANLNVIPFLRDKYIEYYVSYRDKKSFTIGKARIAALKKIKKISLKNYLKESKKYCLKNNLNICICKYSNIGEK